MKTDTENQNSQTRKAKFHLLPTLLFSIGLLVLSTVGTVLALQWFSSRAVVRELSNVIINSEFEAVEELLQTKVRVVSDASKYIEEGVQSGQLSSDDSKDLINIFTGVMAAEKHITGIIFVAPNMNAYRVLRNSKGAIESGSLNINVNPDSNLYKASKAARNQKKRFGDLRFTVKFCQKR